MIESSFSLQHFLFFICKSIKTNTKSTLTVTSTVWRKVVGWQQETASDWEGLEGGWNCWLWRPPESEWLGGWCCMGEGCGLTLQRNSFWLGRAWERMKVSAVRPPFNWRECLMKLPSVASTTIKWLSGNLAKPPPVTTTQVGKLSAVTTSGKWATRRMVLCGGTGMGTASVVDSRRKRLGDIDKNQDRQREKRRVQ